MMAVLKSYIVLTLIIATVLCENKYSKSANEKKKPEVDFRKLEKPFRMNKLNLLWVKAQQRLTEPKLKSLYSDLMVHDKEEITYKRVKSEGGDKEGYKEAELRKKLTNLMEGYGLREHFNSYEASKNKDTNLPSDHHINKSLFKDKKLNQLWLKAESSGFTSEELAALKEEFQHHQDKIDQYYDILDEVNSGKTKEEGYKNVLNEDELERFNEIRASDDDVSKDYLDKANLVREKHRSLRDGYDMLQRKAAKGPDNKEFIEPKVQGLWRMAIAANFTVDELASIKVELQHYESRLLKLRTLHADHVSNIEKHDKKVAAAGDKMDHFEIQQQTIKKHTRKVEKLHEAIESKIRARHTEL